MEQIRGYFNHSCIEIKRIKINGKYYLKFNETIFYYKKIVERIENINVIYIPVILFSDKKYYEMFIPALKYK